MKQDRRLIPLLLFGALFLNRCQDPDSIGNPQSSHCQDLFDSGDFSAALTLCTRLFEQTEDSSAGLVAAQSALKLGYEDLVMEWAERLRGTAAGPDGVYLAAEVHLARKDLSAAIVTTEEVVQLLARFGRNAEIAEVSYLQFYLSWELTNYSDALRFAIRAYEAAERARKPAQRVSALQGIYTVLFEIGDLQGAEQALDLVANDLLRGDASSRVRYYNNLGVLHLDRGQLYLAMGAFREALAQSDDTCTDQQLMRLHINLADTALQLGEDLQARSYLEKADQYSQGDPTFGIRFLDAKLAISSGNPKLGIAKIDQALADDPPSDWKWQFLLEKGRTEEISQSTAAAQEAYSQSISILEEIRSEMGLDELKALLFEKRRLPYNALFELYAKQRDEQMAFVVFEKAMARAFLDRYVSSTEETAVSDETNWLSRALESGNRYEALKSVLPAISVSPFVSADSAADGLPDLGTHTLVGYFQTTDSLWILHLRGGKLGIRQVPAAKSVLLRQISEFIADPSNREAAVHLGDLLLPRDWLPAPGVHLLIAPDGPLLDLPFAALVMNERYLVQDYSISYVPSTTSIRAGLKPNTFEESRMIILADPTGDLPEARLEGEWVGRQLGVTAYLGEEALLKEVRTAAESDLLHVAAHSGGGPSGPWIQLADGTLTTDLILKARIHPRTVVLASCASAANRIPGLWGSLAGAFLAAGSSTVVASLWTIPDSDARTFVQRFYQHRGLTDPVSACALAQRQAIENEEDISSWATFVVYGCPSGEELL